MVKVKKGSFVYDLGFWGNVFGTVVMIITAVLVISAIILWICGIAVYLYEDAFLIAFKWFITGLIVAGGFCFSATH